MSRSGYTDDFGYDNYWDMIRWRGAVNSAIKGRRGQAFLREMLAALDALPVKELIAKELVTPDGQVCAIGAVCKARGVDVSRVDPYDRESVAGLVGVAPALVAEIAYENDEWWAAQEPERRFQHMREWVVSQIKVEP